MSAHTRTAEPDWDNMTDDEIIAFFDREHAFEDQNYEECEE